MRFSKVRGAEAQIFTPITAHALYLSYFIFSIPTL